MMNDQSKKYKLEKTASRAMTVEEAGTHYGYWKHKSYKERLESGCYLIEQFYGVTKKTPLDKTIFSKRKHKYG